MLVRLIYASAATSSVDAVLLDDIKQVAQLNNDRRDLTGMLVFDARHFLQVLEGERWVVNTLLASLQRDPRHRNLTALDLREIPEREFAQWDMAFVPASQASRPLLLRYGVCGRFEPLSMTAGGALGLLLALATAPDRPAASQIRESA